MITELDIRNVAPIPFPSPPSRDKISLSSHLLETLFTRKMDIYIHDTSVGKIDLLVFIKALRRRLFESPIGPPTRIDLVGSAIFSLLEGRGADVHDIDLSLEFEESNSAFLYMMEQLVIDTLIESGAYFNPTTSSPYFRRSLIIDAEFKAALLSIGHKGVFTLDLSFSCLRKRAYLFRRDDAFVPLVPFLDNQRECFLNARDTAPETVLSDRRDHKIVIVRPDEVNHLGWPTLLLLLTKGEELATEEGLLSLKKNFLTFVEKGHKSAIEIIKKVIENHPIKESDSYYISAALALLDDLPSESITLLLDECKKRSSFLKWFKSALQDPIKKSMAGCLAVLLEQIIWPKPSDADWLRYIELIKSEPQLTFKRPGLDTTLFMILQKRSTINPLMKNALDYILETCRKEEFEALLINRIQQEIAQDPECALRIITNYLPKIPLQLKIGFLESLLKEPKSLLTTYNFLEENRTSKTPSLFLLLSKINPTIAEERYWKCRKTICTTKDKWMELLAPYSPSQPLFSEKFSKEIATKLFSFLQTTLPSPDLICLYLFCLKNLPEPFLQPCYKLFYTVLLSGPLSTLTTQDKKTIGNLMLPLWLQLDNEERKKLINTLCKENIFLSIKQPPPFIGEAPIPPNEEALNDLINKTDHTYAIKRHLLEAKLLLLEEEKRSIEARQLHLEQKNLWDNEALLEKVIHHSDLRCEILLAIERPNPRELSVYGFFEEEFTQLYRILLKMGEQGYFDMRLTERLFKISDFENEKIAFTLKHPAHVTKEWLSDFHFDSIHNSELLSLLEWFLEGSQTYSILNPLTTLALKIAPSKIVAYLPKILPHFRANQQEEEKLFLTSICSNVPPISFDLLSEKFALSLYEKLKEEVKLSNQLFTLYILGNSSSSEEILLKDVTTEQLPKLSPKARQVVLLAAKNELAAWHSTRTPPKNSDFIIEAIFLRNNKNPDETLQDLTLAFSAISGLKDHKKNSLDSLAKSIEKIVNYFSYYWITGKELSFYDNFKELIDSFDGEIYPSLVPKFLYLFSETLLNLADSLPTPIFNGWINSIDLIIERISTKKKMAILPLEEKYVEVMIKRNERSTLTRVFYRQHKTAPGRQFLQKWLPEFARTSVLKEFIYKELQNNQGAEVHLAAIKDISDLLYKEKVTLDYWLLLSIFWVGQFPLRYKNGFELLTKKHKAATPEDHNKAIQHAFNYFKTYNHPCCAKIVIKSMEFILLQESPTFEKSLEELLGLTISVAIEHDEGQIEKKVIHTLAEVLFGAIKRILKQPSPSDRLDTLVNAYGSLLISATSSGKLPIEEVNSYFIRIIQLGAYDETKNDYFYSHAAYYSDILEQLLGPTVLEKIDPLIEVLMAFHKKSEKKKETQARLQIILCKHLLMLQMGIDAFKEAFNQTQDLTESIREKFKIALEDKDCYITRYLVKNKKAQYFFT